MFSSDLSNIYETIFSLSDVNKINNQITGCLDKKQNVLLKITEQEYPNIGNIFATKGSLDKSINFVKDNQLCFLEEHVIEKSYQYLKRKNIFEKIEIYNSWLTKTTTNLKSKKHNHRDSFLTAVYYYQATVDQGPLRIFDDKNQYIDILPSTGKLVIFPAKMFHEILTNLTNTARYSIAMNINCT